MEVGYRLKDNSNLASYYSNDKYHTLPDKYNNMTYVIPNLAGSKSSFVGSENFAAVSVVIHSTHSNDFVVTYAIDAIEKDLTY